MCSHTSYCVFFSNQVCLLRLTFEILMFCINLIFVNWCIIGIIHMYLTDNKLLHFILFFAVIIDSSRLQCILVTAFPASG